ncbi:MAG: DUF5011 domain-containing protein [Bacteroidetes bacterium]|nr:DUF5011 domain-containing protein [Bacteroidota bacterium]
MKKILTLSFLLFFTILFSVSGCKKDEDTTPPIITLVGNNPMIIEKDSKYYEPGATVIDDVDGNISSNVVITNNIDITTLGTYQVSYNASDKAGNAAIEVVRTVHVQTF